MKPVVLCIVGCFWLAHCCGSATCMLLHGHQPHEWKKLFFVHHWPVTVCKMSEEACKDPPMYWTIHGLWADRAEDCNKTWHFNISEIQLVFSEETIKITEKGLSTSSFHAICMPLDYFICQDILGDMKQYWPDVLHPNRTQFWKHEWDKHGTCVATLESLNSERNYFSKALELYEKLDLNSYLLKLGIKPGSTYYQLATIRDALTSFYKVTPKIQCVPPQEGEEVQTIGQIKFCFTKEFNLRNCTESKAISYLAHKNTFFNTEELSNCNDTLTYYPAKLQLHK